MPDAKPRRPRRAVERLTALVTHSFATMGEMSCNPAIGGFGQRASGARDRRARRVDGARRRCGWHSIPRPQSFARAPQSRGRAPRRTESFIGAPCRALISETPNLTVVEGEAARIIIRRRRRHWRRVVDADGRTIFCGAVVLTTGTFLRGMIHLGDQRTPCRPFRRSALGLARPKPRQRRLCARAAQDGNPAAARRTRTIDWDQLEIQQGDRRNRSFSHRSRPGSTAPQLPCHITRTTAETHRIIQADAHLSAVYSGAISGRGPRYCPSIEDKVIRFADRDSHQIFLEPEGVDDPTVYPNGISTSLPETTQRALIATIP